jgi:outer membrane protein assembly factor BamB
MAHHDETLVAVSKDVVLAYNTRKEQLSWKRTLPEYTEVTPIISFGNAVIQTADHLVSVSLSDGTTRWKRDEGHTVTDSSNNYRDGIVYVTTTSGVHGIDVSTGKEVWSASIPTAANGVAVTPSLVVVCAGASNLQGSVQAFDIASGKKQWKTSGIKSFTAPSITKGLIVAFSTDGTVYGLNISDGSKRWSVSTGGKNTYESPAINKQRNEAIVTNGTGGSLVAVDLLDGNINWRTNLGSYVGQPPILTDNHIIAGTNRVHVLSKSGTVHRSLSYRPFHGMVLTNDSIYVNDTGDLVRIG